MKKIPGMIVTIVIMIANLVYSSQAFALFFPLQPSSSSALLPMIRCGSTTSAATVSPRSATTTTTTTTTTAKVVTTDNNDMLTRPTYEIEKIPLRIGHGFDIHRMAPIEEAGQPIVIGGVVIDHKPQKWTDTQGNYVEKGGIYETELGVVAHSDGDVIYHSIVDAIFGALTLPDIGQVFQDNDPRWKGCDSSKFMEHAVHIMKEHGYRIGNVDVTLILERPKVASFKIQMKENIVNLLDTTLGRVNIKARTHERVDSAGELRSLSCHVVLTLELA